jgi:hypothetical protein
MTEHEPTSVYTKDYPKAVGDRFIDAVCEGEAASLKSLIETYPNCDVLGKVYKGYNGTLHYHALSSCMLAANPKQVQSMVLPFIECARLLRQHGAPVEHKTHPGGLAMAFLDSRWGRSMHRDAIAELMAEYIESGLLNPNEPLTAEHRFLGGLSPLACAFKVGNPTALKVLLERGADIPAALNDTGHSDIIEYAGSFYGPESGEVTSVLAEHVMSERFRAIADTGVGNDDALATPRRRRAGV